MNTYATRPPTKNAIRRSPRVSVSMTPAVWRTVRTQAQQQKRSMSWVVAQLLGAAVAAQQTPEGEP